MADVLGIIPARGGSKRIPNKNIREVGGVPLLYHTIRDASEANVIDEFVVSSDDSDILQVAEEYGSRTIERPSEFAQDETPIAPVISHAIEETEAYFDAICLLQPTTPLRTASDIKEAVQQLLRTESESVISITEPFNPPHWALSETADGYLKEMFEPTVLWGDIQRSQDLPDTKVPNGAVYATTIENWKKYESFYTPRTVGYEMPPFRSIDIDERWELEVAEALMQYDGDLID